MMSVELNRTSHMLESYASTLSSSSTSRAVAKLGTDLASRSKSIRDGIYTHAAVDHPKHGKVFAYEVDGYGSHLLMDDANVPSLLSLPLLGFVDASDEVYQNTRKMILLLVESLLPFGALLLRHRWATYRSTQCLAYVRPRASYDFFERYRDHGVFGAREECVGVRIDQRECRR